MREMHFFIEKSNSNKNSEETEDVESNSSNRLIIDEVIEKSDGGNNDTEESQGEKQVLTSVSKCREIDVEIIKDINSTNSMITTSSDTCTSSGVQSTALSSYSNGESY